MPAHGMFFEDYKAGQVFEHSRSRTMTEMDNVLLTHLTMNTSAAHFDRQFAKELLGGQFEDRLVMGGVVLGVVVGLTSQDMSENALSDLGYGEIRFVAPVFHGHTLSARSEVLKVADSPERTDCGVVTYRFEGTNQDGKKVVQGWRSVLVRRRPTDHQ